MLLLNSNIGKKVTENIHGKILRIGGRVDQLVNYKNCSVIDINIPDGGYGQIKNRETSQVTKSNFIEMSIHHMVQELKYILLGARIPRDRKTVILNLHEVSKRVDIHSSYDSIISSNVIEHSPNPILFLLNAYLLGKETAFQFHAIPHYKYTFDRYRKPTEIEHIVKDFVNNTSENDETHNSDYSYSAIEKDGYKRDYHKIFPIKYPYIHMHVFDENNVRALFEMMFEDVEIDIIKTERFSDIVVFFKNKLQEDFVNQYSRYLPFVQKR